MGSPDSQKQEGGGTCCCQEIAAAVDILLPHDMILEILAKLPVKFLLRLRCVSKSWNFIVTDPHFLNLLRKSDKPSILYHPPLNLGSLTSLNFNDEHCLFNCSGGSRRSSSSSGLFMPVRTYIPWEEEGVKYDDIYFIKSSCNGLILVQVWRNVLILWNPSTRQFRYLPECPDSPSPYSWYDFCCGIGYHALTDDYKVVKFSRTKIHVFSVKSNTWGDGIVHGIVHDPNVGMYSRDVIFLGGVFHWLSAPKVPDYRVTTFELGTEEIGEILLPKLEKKLERHNWITLGTLSGWLCFWYYYNHNRNLEEDYYSYIDISIDVWVLKESSWTKLCVVRPHISHRCHPSSCGAFVPYLFSKEDEELMGIINRKHWELVAVKFNVRNLTFENVLSWPLRACQTGAYHFPYMESLVPI